MLNILLLLIWFIILNKFSIHHCVCGGGCSFIFTSADGNREIPRSCINWIGYAGKLRMAIQDITSYTAVADLVPNIKPCAIQYTFGWNSWVSTGATLQFCNTEGKKENVELFKCTLMFYDYKTTLKCDYHFSCGEKSDWKFSIFSFSTGKINCGNMTKFSCIRNGIIFAIKF